jgi:hypothetical protein
MAVMSALSAGLLIPSGRILVLVGVRGCLNPRAVLCLEGLVKYEKSGCLTGNRTLHLLVCSTVPQSTALLPVSLFAMIMNNAANGSGGTTWKCGLEQIIRTGK